MPAIDWPNPFSGAEAYITEYITRYRRADVPPLIPSQPLDLFPDEVSSSAYRAPKTWLDPWPNADSPGVYLLYADDLKLIYVGVAKRLGTRLEQYFGGGKICVLRDRWGISPRYLLTVAVPCDMFFEAPALEAYLIRKLQPELNTAWR